MNLSEPLDGLTGPVNAAVIRALARTDTGLSGRQVGTIADVGSTSSVYRSLTGLVQLGLVTAESVPPAILYRINRNHALWPAIELGLDARNRVFESIHEFCVNELPEELNVTVVVYGSVARRESTPDSDIDLLVVYPDGIDPDYRADYSYQLAQHVLSITGNDAQIFDIERSELADRIHEHDPLINNILTDGIHIHGPALPRNRRGAA